MNILILYTSIEGQTRKIAETAAKFFEGRGWRVSIANVNSMMEYSLERPDAAMLLAPVHSGHYPTPFTHFVHQEKEWLNAMPTAFVSVGLSIISEVEEERKEAEIYPDKLLAATGWAPAKVYNAAGALRLTEFDFFKRWMVRRLAKHTKGEMSPNGDCEYTDWAAFEAFCEEFAGECVKTSGQ